MSDKPCFWGGSNIVLYERGENLEGYSTSFRCIRPQMFGKKNQKLGLMSYFKTLNWHFVLLLWLKKKRIKKKKPNKSKRKRKSPLHKSIFSVWVPGGDPGRVPVRATCSWGKGRPGGREGDLGDFQGCKIQLSSGWVCLSVAVVIGGWTAARSQRATGEVKDHRVGLHYPEWERPMWLAALPPRSFTQSLAGSFSFLWPHSSSSSSAAPAEYPPQCDPRGWRRFLGSPADGAHVDNIHWTSVNSPINLRRLMNAQLRSGSARNVDYHLLAPLWLILYSNALQLPQHVQLCFFPRFKIQPMQKNK